MLKEVYRMLVIAFGQPAEFEYTMRDAKGKVISTKTYTPQSFYKGIHQRRTHRQLRYVDERPHKRVL